MIIDNEHEYEVLFAHVGELMKKGETDCSELESEVIGILAKAIEAYEDQEYNVGE
jgi:antitoxin component HigA of HigAB toxin-antitoxin module